MYLTMNPQTNSIFFTRLPLDISRKIYEDYLEAIRKASTRWNFSPNYENHLAQGRYIAVQLPCLAFTCKKIHEEFAPFTVGTFYIWVVRTNRGRSLAHMVGFNRKHAAGCLRLSTMRKCTIRVDNPEFLGTWAKFLGLVLSDEQRRSSEWFSDHDIDQDARDGKGAATQLEEITIKWSIRQPLRGASHPQTETAQESDGDGDHDVEVKRFFNQIAGVEALKVVRLKSNYPD